MKRIVMISVVLTFVLIVSSFGFAAEDKPGSVQTKLTTQDIDYLKKQCQIEQVDIDIVTKLNEAGQKKLMGAIDMNDKDCKGLTSFKATRAYLQKYYPPPDKSPMPPKGYDIDFLTTDEFDYVSKINEALLMKLLESPDKEKE